MPLGELQSQWIARTLKRDSHIPTKKKCYMRLNGNEKNKAALC